MGVGDRGLADAHGGRPSRPRAPDGCYPVSQRVFSVKLSSDRLADLEQAAAEAGLTRHAFVREALEAALAPAGPRITLADRNARLVRERFRTDREAWLAAQPRGTQS